MSDFNHQKFGRVEFGAMVRTARRARKMTIADLAFDLGFSVSYVSDVERGNRPPWADEFIPVLAHALGLPEHDLIRAAAIGRGFFQLPADRGLEVGALLVRLWGGLSSQDFGSLLHQLRAFDAREYTRVDVIDGVDRCQQFATIEDALEQPPVDGRSLVLQTSTSRSRDVQIAIARGSSTTWIACPDADDYEGEAINESGAT